MYQKPYWLMTQGNNLKNKGNAKSLYSRTQIQESMLKLIKHKKFEEITIKEIVDGANVSRKTFYRNFDSKIEILDVEISKISSEYIQALHEITDLTFHNIVFLIFTVADNNHEFIKSLVDNNLLYLLLDRIYEKVILVYDIRGKEILRIYGKNAISNSLRFIFGGFERYIKEWLKEDNRKSPLQVQKDFEAVIEIWMSVLMGKLK
ncbi:hypothetical protein A5819_001044 [Enterococcus sp. 7E2_DIV0204]|uniref:TetR/AcrR family transcriptional regulator n=1 Tax=unclassified Enterococcus TaxID=2608891 RepID=UPI000A34236C|nr:MULTISPECIES: TetR/AcrR family transcriptional regulator [unclassified Enterococcus]OTN88563.1 hypothetical protein A5819_001044 [Enterococcus sp. 7E2_DIV0204]OTP51032.1 hypothetical protein A5884_000218 [Enterococcus sp. 7D2_DIV0200]